MDAQLKAKWVEALRSGEYAQGKMQLREGDKFCCLGVLCVVGGLEIDAKGEEIVIDGRRDGYTPLNPIIGAEFLGPLYTRNDQGTPFSEIADYIEANL